MGNPWLDHVKVVMKNNPKLSFKQVLKKAKKTYKKKVAPKKARKAQQTRKVHAQKNKSRKHKSRKHNYHIHQLVHSHN